SAGAALGAGTGGRARPPSAMAGPPAPAGRHPPPTREQGARAAAPRQPPPSDLATVQGRLPPRRAGTTRAGLQRALHSGPNPNAEFYSGRGSSDGGAWDGASRTYRVAGTETWANASFFDPASQLSAREVALFERAANQLLRNAAPYAHACALKVSPT